MKKLYLFQWNSGAKKEKPLQAHSVNQALMVLVKRYQDINPDFSPFIIYDAFKRGELTYEEEEPYQHLRQPNPPPKEAPKKKKKDAFQDLSFKSFVDNDREAIQRKYGPI